MAEERPGLTGNSNLTSHVNDPAMRRSLQKPAAAGGASETSVQSDASPLAGATPAEEDARRALEATAADQRARRKDLPARPEIDEWQAFEHDRQGRI